MISKAAVRAPAGASGEPPIRVMLVDDSGVSRALMERWLSEAGVEIVAAARNGEEARDLIAKARPDTVLLDIEMPKLCGMTVLPELLERLPGVRVVMASTLSQRGARITIEAMQLGAADAIAKPAGGWASSGAPEFRAELIRKVKALGRRDEAPRAKRPLTSVAAAAPAGPAPQPQQAKPAKPAQHAGPKPDIVVIGSSTGGPNALFKMLSGFPAPPTAPILIAQHMPPTFTAIFGEHLGRLSGLDAAEAVHGEALLPGRIYIAPGGRHLEVIRSVGGGTVLLSDAPPENFCRPSVNPLFRSAAAWGSGALGFMLTGMGSDGLEGSRSLKAGGARLLVQDAETSVVWGMPGTVARAGLADAVMPLDELTQHLHAQVTP